MQLLTKSCEGRLLLPFSQAGGVAGAHRKPLTEMHAFSTGVVGEVFGPYRAVEYSKTGWQKRMTPRWRFCCAMGQSLWAKATSQSLVPAQTPTMSKSTSMIQHNQSLIAEKIQQTRLRLSSSAAKSSKHSSHRQYQLMGIETVQRKSDRCNSFS